MSIEINPLFIFFIQLINSILIKCLKRLKFKAYNKLDFGFSSRLINYGVFGLFDFHISIHFVDSNSITNLKNLLSLAFESGSYTETPKFCSNIIFISVDHPLFLSTKCRKNKSN